MASGYSIIATAITSDGVKKLEDKNIRTIQGKMDYKALVSKCRELSRADTNPTGTPTISPGKHIPLSTDSSNASSAVGASPTINID